MEGWREVWLVGGASVGRLALAGVERDGVASSLHFLNLEVKPAGCDATAVLLGEVLLGEVPAAPLHSMARISLLALLGLQLLCCSTVFGIVKPQVGFTYRYSFSTLCRSAGKDVRGANEAGAQAPHTAQLVADVSVLARDGKP